MAEATVMTRIPAKVKQKVDAIAASERRPIQTTIEILLEEAIAHREQLAA